jgi:hypothetical protein
MAMLCDGLNLYGALWIVNMVNVLLYLIVKPTGDNGLIKTVTRYDPFPIPIIIDYLEYCSAWDTMCSRDSICTTSATAKSSRASNRLYFNALLGISSRNVN